MGRKKKKEEDEGEGRRRQENGGVNWSKTCDKKAIEEKK